MPKSKNRKDHKKKVAARNEKIKHAKNRNDKMQRDFIMNLIKQEQEKGLFENTQSVSDIIDNSLIEGPSI
jgi:glycyl-tRNA synthetase beta subunit